MGKAPLLLAALLWALPVAAEKYRVEDSGSFASTGRRIEFADRYGWRSYRVRFDFDLDSSGRELGKGSSLELRIERKEGRPWSARCKASEGRLGANVNRMVGKGVLLMAECRLKTAEFAKVVGVKASEAGEPILVFHATLEGGQARAGQQKGLLLLPSRLVAPELVPYLSRDGDPSELAVPFVSRP